MTLVAPARYILTTAHITTDHARTLCGQPLDDEGLWQDLPDGAGVPMCRGCELVHRRQAPRTIAHGE